MSVNPENWLVYILGLVFVTVNRALLDRSIMDRFDLVGTARREKLEGLLDMKTSFTLQSENLISLHNFFLKIPAVSLLSQMSLSLT